MGRRTLGELKGIARVVFKEREDMGVCEPENGVDLEGYWDEVEDMDYLCMMGFPTLNSTDVVL